MVGTPAQRGSLLDVVFQTSPRPRLFPRRSPGRGLENGLARHRPRVVSESLPSDQPSIPTYGMDILERVFLDWYSIRHATSGGSANELK